MPKTFSGLIGFAITSVLTVIVGMWIVNRVDFLAGLVYGKKAA